MEEMGVEMRKRRNGRRNPSNWGNWRRREGEEAWKWECRVSGELGSLVLEFFAGDSGDSGFGGLTNRPVRESYGNRGLTVVFACIYLFFLSLPSL